MASATVHMATHSDWSFSGSPFAPSSLSWKAREPASPSSSDQSRHSSPSAVMSPLFRVSAPASFSSDCARSAQEEPDIVATGLLWNGCSAVGVRGEGERRKVD